MPKAVNDNEHTPQAAAPDGAGPQGKAPLDSAPGAGGPTAQKPADVSTAGACPICGKPAEVQWRPFCSRRCADVDLHRWLSGSYAIPATEVDEDEQE